MPPSNPECKHCDLLKSTVDDTGVSCVRRTGMFAPMVHDFDSANPAEINTKLAVNPKKSWEEKILEEFEYRLFNEWVNQIDLDDINIIKSFLQQKLTEAYREGREDMRKELNK